MSEYFASSRFHHRLESCVHEWSCYVSFSGGTYHMCMVLHSSVIYLTQMTDSSQERTSWDLQELTGTTRTARFRELW
jgi:hypothetical protein